MRDSCGVPGVWLRFGRRDGWLHGIRKDLIGGFRYLAKTERVQNLQQTRCMHVFSVRQWLSFSWRVLHRAAI